jgi:hypothetical protein
MGSYFKANLWILTSGSVILHSCVHLLIN